MKNDLENFRDFGFIFPSFSPFLLTSFSSPTYLALSTRINCFRVSPLVPILIPFVCFLSLLLFR